MALDVINEKPFSSSHEENVISIKSSPTPKSKKHQLEIERETGLDGKVRSIRLDNSANVSGVRVYGIPKNKEIDSRKMEKTDPKPVLRGDPRSNNAFNNSRLDNNDQVNGFIERIPIVDKVKELSKRSIDKNYFELDDLETAEAKVFRPLFVYRQQVNRRKAQKQKQKNKTYPKKYDPLATPKSKPIYYRHLNNIY